jgi:ATP/maltotriose-dependent transcriptional regulator MalT
MAAIEEAKRLVRAGCFSEALAALDAGRVGSADKTAADVLRTELLERVGHYDLAHRHATELLKSRRLNATERSACCFVLAHLESLAGKADAAIEWLQRAVSFAERDGNHERACWAKLRLLVLVADHSGFEAAVSLVSDLRASAIRSADPAIVAAVHLYVAQTEAKRGLLSTPRKHVRLALDLLKSAPNVWLASMASHIESAVAIMRVDFGHAATHAKRAVELAEQSGVTHSIVSCVGTLAHIQVVTGDLDSAVLLQKSSLSKSLIGSDNYIGSLETLARIRLLQNRLEECDQVLEQIDQLSDPSRSSLRYVHRYMMLTRADLASRRQRLDEALVHIETAIRLGQGAEDQLLIHIATLKKAELLATDSRCDEALATLAQIAPTVSSQPLDVHALSERVLGSILCNEGQPNAGASHLARARRVYETLHHASGLIELDWLRQAATAKTPGVSSSRGTHPTDSLAGSPAVTLESIAALFLYADRPDLVARELTEWARSAGLFESVRTVLRKSDRSDECVASDGTRFPSEERHLAVGATPDGDISVAFVLKSGVEPVAVFEAIRALLESVRQLQTARHEREQRATLWPVEELPIEGDSSVISGHMRELMTYARRIAKTKVNVLITGVIGRQQNLQNRVFPQARGDRHVHRPGRIASPCCERRAA